LINLAVNARDAMPDGGKLTIATSNVEIDDADPEIEAGEYVTIAVSDTGSGISAEVIDRVFDPFFTTQGPGRGTGLGLSQVYGFIKQSGGHIRLHSEPGDGTTVRMYFPRYAGAASADHSSAIADAGVRGNGEVILVVEDDDTVRANTVEILRDLGYSVLEAADGNAALEICAGTADIDLLFTDIVLRGELSGREVAEKFVHRRPQTKVLYTTGYSRDVIVHHGRLDPGIALITKPFLMHDLAQKIASVLNG
jgi:CheY-like chemotaxis protein